MPTADVYIVHAGTPPPWADLSPAAVVHLNDPVLRVALVEGGMGSGEPSIALRLDLPPGGETDTASSVIAETSLAVFIAIMAAARGAFPEAFAGGPFEDRGEDER